MRAVCCFVAILCTAAAGRAAQPWDRWIESARASLSTSHSSEPGPEATRKWSPRRLADFDFGAPVVDAIAFDARAGGAEELVVLTTAELVVIGGFEGDKPEVVQRLPLRGAAATVAAREPFGFLEVVSSERGRELWARTSAHAVGLRYIAGSSLRRIGTFPGVPACSSRTARRADNTNLLRPLVRGNEPFYVSRCLREFRAADGSRIDGRVTLDASLALSLTGSRCRGGACGVLPGAKPLLEVGRAFEAGDINGDGRLEVVTTSASVPGQSDRIRVALWEGAKLRELFADDVELGIISVSLGEYRAKPGLELVSLHRQFRSHRVELWGWN